MVAGLRARSAVVFGRSGAILLVGALSCSSGPSRPGSSLPLASVAVGAARLDVHTPSGRPRVVLVARDGDPASALAAAIEVDGAPSALSALGEAMRRRFEDTPGARVEVASGSLFVALDFDEPEKSLAKLRTILMTPLSSEEERVAIASRPRLPRAATPELAATLACTGRLSARPDETEVAKGTVERLRASMVRSDRIALAVVGPQASTEALLEALTDGDAWPEVPASPPKATPARPFSIGASAAADVASGLRLRIAVGARRPEAAVAAARRLGATERPATALASHADLKLSEVIGTASPSGGCMTATWSGASSTDDANGASAATARQERARQIGALVGRLATELPRELDEPWPEDLAAREVVAARDPRDAATLAAWWALAGPGKTPAIEAVSIELSHELDAQAVASFGAEAARVAKEPRPAVKPSSVSRLERGQRDVWVMLADPCAAVEEPAHLWGSAALAVRTAEPATTDDGEAFFFSSPSGVGFVARATPLPDETPERTAARATALAASGFYAEPPSEEDLLEAQELLRRDIERLWGRGAPGLDVHAAAVADPPASFEPLGPPGDATKRTSIEIWRRLRSLSRDPLRLAVLAHATDGEARAAEEEAARWLAASPPRACAKPRTEARPQRLDIKRPLRGPSRAHLTLTADDAVLAAFTAHLLGKKDGLLGQALRPVAGATVTARVTGHAGARHIVVNLAAPPESIDEAVRLTSELFSRLGRGELPDAEIVRSATSFVAAERDALGDPVVRLERLFEGLAATPPAAPSAAAFRTFASKSLSESRLVITVVRPE